MPENGGEAKETKGENGETVRIWQTCVDLLSERDRNGLELGKL